MASFSFAQTRIYITLSTRPYYLNCEGGQIKMPKEALDDYMARYCANSTAWRSCTIARALLLNYERKERHDKQAKDRRA